MDDRFMVSVRDIVVDKDRGRREFKNLHELMESIGKYGLLHPLVVRKMDNGKWRLMAGERRFRSMLLLGWTEIPCTPFESIDDTMAKRIELEENIRRENISWTEECETLRQIDELEGSSGRASQGSGDNEGKWSLKKLADKTGKSTATLSIQINLARKLNERPDLKERVQNLPMYVAVKKVKQIEEQERMERLSKDGLLEIRHDLLLGSCVDLLADLSDSSIDLVITDPPFGIDVLEHDIISQKGGPSDSQSYKQVANANDNMARDDVMALLDEVIPLLFQKMKPGSHFYMFFGWSLYDHIVRKMRSEGFVVQHVPIIWDKGRTTTPFMGYYYASSYEPVLFGCKPPRDKRLINPCKDIVLHKPVESKKKIHVFEKPLELLKYFILQSTNKGDLILDPFAGSGSSLVAGLELGRSVKGFELSKANFMRAQKRLTGLDGE